MKTLDPIEYAWTGLDFTKLGDLYNPFYNFNNETLALDFLRIMRNPEYIYLGAKYLLNIDLLPEQSAVLWVTWKHAFPMWVASRGFGKSFLLAVYSLLRCTLVPATKVVIAGAAFRQSKLVFEYAENLWNNSGVLQSLCDENSGVKKDTDRWTLRLNDSQIIAIPIGTGDKIRGLRANIIVADEFASQSPDIYETVISGFAAVTSDPVANVKEFARKKALLAQGIPLRSDAINNKLTNQSIITGTADYAFRHFAQYWKRYRAIIQSGGDVTKLAEIFGKDNVPSGFNYRDYAVVRMPYELIPEGFMDDKIVSRAKATIHSSTYALEYGAVFAEDSDGFFKRSLIESCVASDKNVSNFGWASWCPNTFDAIVRGSQSRKYVYGVDPASEQDNFSIVILELHNEHRRVVYCWSTNRKDFKEKLKAGMTSEHDFYGFCARKIRDLMKVFPCEVVGCDAQGGGIAVEEALHDPDKINEGERPIWTVINLDKPKDSDNYGGDHILEMIQFANASWTATANHSLRKDFEDKALLFPRFDPISLEIAYTDDEARKKLGASGKTVGLYDSLEDCILEIEELKAELATIQHTRTGTGVQSRERWDTPEYRSADGRKGRLRKDRYSALVIANSLARTIQRAPEEIKQDLIGGITTELAQHKHQGKLYQGPEWFTNNINNGCVLQSVNR